MAFVHGHARDNGWVVAHVRAPVGAEDGQLPLEPDPAGPTGSEPADPVEPAPGDGAVEAPVVEPPSPAAGRPGGG
jgi:hypothetical protein